jgi:large subunit ribosomal protein L17
MRARKLGRREHKRKELLSSLIRSLVVYESITTTRSRGKEVKRMFDFFVSRAKKQYERDYVSGIRYTRRWLKDEQLAVKFYNTILSRLMEVNGGYTNMYPTYDRPSDSAPRVKLVIVNG